MKTILAWHFVGEKLRDGRPVPADGVTLEHDGPMEMCKSGLHASKRIIDALQYAPVNRAHPEYCTPGRISICRVRCAVEVEHDNDKLICRERTILWRVNGENLLRKFACKQALSVAHLWDMPQIVREYLETQDDSKRAYAYTAAHSAAAAAYAYTAAYYAATAAANAATAANYANAANAANAANRSNHD
jgi:hypothetical protein